MAEAGNPTTGGGAATSRGTTFQEDVACYFSTLILADEAATPPLSLPQDVRLCDIVAESAQPIDDLAVRTSEGGVLYIQAKTRLSLSRSYDSEFAKVIGQFVRQMIAGAHMLGNQVRQMEKGRDRFALVIGHSSPATISEDLLNLLDYVRTCTTTADLATRTLSQNKSILRKLQVIRDHVSRQWKETSGRLPTGEQELSLLHLIHVLQLDLRPDGRDTTRAKDLLRNQVLRDANRADDAWDALISVCRNFGPMRTGGDLAYLREQLETKRLQLRSVPSFVADIESLRKYSKDRLAYLAHLSYMTLGGERIRIDREVVGDLRDFTTDGHTVVIGEPGAGKSGCVHCLATALLEEGKDVVLLAADMVKASSPEELARDLCLSGSRTLVDVLQNWAGDGYGYLLVDALDAARAGMSLHVLCRVLRAVTELAPRWRIVASIREYDLRVNPAVQELFEGDPHPKHIDGRFPKVRHVCVRVLCETELRPVVESHPELAPFLTCGSPLLNLVRNPFNLSLLCRLIAPGISAADLNNVRTQVELLDLYWAYRVDTSDKHARLSILVEAVSQMVNNRELHVPSLSLLPKVASNASTVDLLLSDSVLIELPGRSEASPRLGFAHNILFDYAVHRLWLDGLSDSTIARLSESANHDLLLAIRPSITMVFESLWNKEEDRASFWKRAIAFVDAKGMRLIGKIISSGVAARRYQSPSDVAVVLEKLPADDGPGATLIRFMIQSAITCYEGDGERFPMLGPSAAAWMELAAVMSNHLDRVAWDVHSLLRVLSQSKEAMTPDQASFANQAARSLLEFGLANSQCHNLVCTAIEVAARTIEAAPQPTVATLRQVLSDENIRLAGHEWLQPLAEQIVTIAKCDVEFTLDLVDVLFSVTGGRDDRVHKGGRILALSFNKYDMLKMGRYIVSEIFPHIMETAPATATRIMLHVMKAVVAKEHASAFDAEGVHELTFREGHAKLQPDCSYVWAAGHHGMHDDWRKILHTFEVGLQSLAAKQTTELASVLDVLRDENQYAIVWNTLLSAAAKAPDTLGCDVVDLLLSTAVLVESGTRKAAGDLVQSGYPSFTPEQRRDIEATILRITEKTPDEETQYAVRDRNRILGCIPIDLIQSPQLRSLRDELDASGGPPPNVPDFSISHCHGDDDQDWWLRHQGVVPEKPENAPLLEALNLLNEIPDSQNSQPPAASQSSEYLPLLEQGRNAIAAGMTAGADTPLLEHVEAKVINACSRLARTRDLHRDMPLARFIRATLHDGAKSSRPAYRVEDDEEWDKKLQAWSSPSPRIDAAKGLMYLASKPQTTDPQILEDIDQLASDDVPAVRFQILCNLLWLSETAYDMMWKQMERCCRSEPRTGILSFFCDSVLLSVPSFDAARAEPLVRTLYQRCRRSLESDDVRVACATFYLRALLLRNDRRAERYLNVFRASPSAFSVEANSVVHSCQDLIRWESPDMSEKENGSVRQWAFRFLTDLVIAIKNRATVLRDEHPNAPLDQWPANAIDELRLLHQLASNVAKQIYFASDAFDARRSEHGHNKPAGQPSEEEKRRFLEEGAALFDAICDIEFVETAYDVLQTLEFLIGSDQPGVLLRIAKIVRRSTNDGIQYESLAAGLIVRIVERYLSEYGHLLRENADTRTALIDILDVFVEAGWPGATRLTYRLGEVFR